MKTLFLIAIFALVSMFAVGCLSSEETVSDETVETSTTESALEYSCLERCSDEYNSCLTGDPFDDCLCRNSYVLCRRGCGYPGGWLQKCWPN